MFFQTSFQIVLGDNSEGSQSQAAKLMELIILQFRGQIDQVNIDLLICKFCL